MTFIPSLPSVVSTSNSSSTPLAGGATFTGTGEAIQQYASVTVAVQSDVNSAAAGVVVEFSPDNSSWVTERTCNFRADHSCCRLSLAVSSAYLRVSYTNGAAAQSSFQLQTILHADAPAGASTAQLSVPPEPLLDAFGRLRVSNPTTLLEGSYVRSDSNDPIFTSETSGTGTLTVGASVPSADLSVVTSGDVARVQTRRRGVYQPGKSLEVALTGVLNAATNAAGVTARMGFFDADDGIFLEHRGDGGAGSLFIVVRTSQSGSPVDTAVAQADWNLDKFDGSGASGTLLDAAKAQILFVDIEWLGVGRVRVGFFIGGTLVYAHEILHANLVTQPYINAAAQPCRYEIASTAGGGTLRQICCMAASEGGHNPKGRGFAADNGNSGKGIAGTELPVLSLRLKSTGKSPKVQVRFHASSSTIGTNSTLAIRLGVYRDTAASAILTGASWTSANASSAVEYDMAATSFTTTGRTLITTAYITRETPWTLIDFSKSDDGVLTANIAGVSDLLVASAINLGGGTDSVYLGLSWIEEY